ncbi:MAG: HNH endonuclease [Candidatus Limnocylindria bacterium]
MVPLQTSRSSGCGRCGRSLEQTESLRRYCSNLCKYAAYHERRRAAVKCERVGACVVCGTLFITRQAFRMFCTRQCKTRSDHRRWPQDPARVRERVQAWYWLNSDRAKQRAKLWNHANRAAKYQPRQAHRQLLRSAGPLSPDVWQDILRQHEHRCAYCGASGPLTIDHRVPLSRGGRNAKDNIKPACRSCNSKKATRSEDDFLGALAREALDALSGTATTLNRA